MNKPILLLFFACIFLSVAQAQSFTFAQLTGSPVNTAGWNLTGNAVVGNSPVGGGNSEIILTGPFNSQSGAIFFTEPIDIVQCNKWTVDFEFRAFDGTSADGLAFCLLDVPPSGFVGGGGVGIPNTANGLKVVFDTYNNCGAANPAIQIRYGAGYTGGECNASQPTLDNSGQLGFIRSNNYNSARITYDAGNIQVYLNGTLYLSGFYVINFTTYAGFTASTGAANDRHSIRNVSITTERAQPQAYSGPNAVTCSGQVIQIGGASNPNYQYQWSPTTGLDNSTIANPRLTLTNTTQSPQTFQYVVGANIIGTTCVQYDTVQVTVNPIPNADFSTNDPGYCINENGTITYDGWAPPGATYNWNFDGATVVSGSGQGPYTVNWATSGTKNLSLTVTHNNCTSAQFDLQVPVYDYPTSDFIITPAVCPNINADVEYTGTAASTATYTWNFNGGTVNSGSGQGPYTVSWPTPGTKTVTLTVTENGCQSTQTQEDILIYTIPTANFTVTSPVCENSPSAINYTGTGTAAGTYTWNWDGGAATPLGSENYDASWATAGTKTVTLTVTENGCPSPMYSQNVTVLPIPQPSFTITAHVCQGADAVVTYTAPLTPGASYNWFWNGGTASNIANQDYNVNWNVTGIYPVSVTVSLNGCVSEPYVQVVTVDFQPTADFYSEPYVCIGEPLDIQFTGAAPPTSVYDWSLTSGSYTGSGQTITATWPNVGTPSITLTVTEGNCSDTKSKDIDVKPDPKPTIEPGYNICLGEEVKLDAGPYESYLWNDGGNDRIHYIGEPGTYTVRVVDKYGCEGIGFTTVTDTNCISLFIPNAFTPNGDHHNDVFKPESAYTMDYTLWIYNRWGQLLFTTQNADAVWDGREGNKPCQPDIYVYKLEYAGLLGEKIVKGIRTGTIALIR